MDFLSSGVRPEWGIVLWFQSDIPLKIIIEFVQPHLTITIYPTFSIPNDRRPELSWIKVACALQKLDQLFQGKTLQTVFFTKISPARSSKEMSNTLWFWGFKLWLLLHLCQTNFVLIFAVCLSITTPWIQKYEIVRQGISQFCLDICSLHTINQILNPKRDVTILSGYLQFAYN